MRTNLRKCDRCGAVFERDTTIPYYRYSKIQYVSKIIPRRFNPGETYKMQRMLQNKTYDLCFDCQKDFERFLKNE